MAADLLTRRELRAMSCGASLVLTIDGDTGGLDPSGLLDRGTDRLHQLEQRWSRFLDDSEITGLNRADGAARRCSDDTVRLVEHMVAGWNATDACFDPSLLGALVELGYAASREDATAHTSLAPDLGYERGVELIEIDRTTSVVR